VRPQMNDWLVLECIHLADDECYRYDQHFHNRSARIRAGKSGSVRDFV
jgi:hypothetical protein